MNTEKLIFFFILSFQLVHAQSSDAIKPDYASKIDTIQIKGIVVYGKPVDNQTRCVHYHSPLDIIAIKFKCCSTYYPCFSCHAETTDHKPEVWPTDEFNEKAILCGACGHELSITEYMACNNTCPKCLSLFNPGCKNHYHLYFEAKSESPKDNNSKGRDN